MSEKGNPNVVIARHEEVPRAIRGEHFVEPNLRCIIGYYGTADGRPISVIVGTGTAGDRVFHYAMRDDVAPRTGPWLTDATPEMIAAVREYGFRDGMPDDACAG